MKSANLQTIEPHFHCSIFPSINLEVAKDDYSRNSLLDLVLPYPVQVISNFSDRRNIFGNGSSVANFSEDIVKQYYRNVDNLVHTELPKSKLKILVYDILIFNLVFGLSFKNMSFASIFSILKKYRNIDIEPKYI